jgi:26S proteasome regulatory subunit N1
MAPKNSDAVSVAAESDKMKEDDKAKKLKKSEGDLKEDTMSEEDRSLKDRLETCVSTVVNESNEDSVTIPIRLTALDVIVNELRTATSSMTSVPKPLKFLRPYFSALKTLYVSLEKQDVSATDEDSLEFRARLADVLAVLAMTMGNPGAWLPWFSGPSILCELFLRLVCLASHFRLQRTEKV